MNTEWDVFLIMENGEESWISHHTDEDIARKNARQRNAAKKETGDCFIVRERGVFALKVS